MATAAAAALVKTRQASALNQSAVRQKGLHPRQQTMKLTHMKTASATGGVTASQVTIAAREDVSDDADSSAMVSKQVLVDGHKWLIDPRTSKFINYWDSLTMVTASAV